MSAPAPLEMICVEEAKRRLAARLGVCVEMLRRTGYVARIRERGRYLGQQRTLDGGLRLSCFRVPASAVDEIADEALAALPQALSRAA